VKRGGPRQRPPFSLTFAFGLRWLTATFALLGCAAPPQDVLITDARYLRGSEITASTANIGVRDGRISYLGAERPAARRTIDGRGRVLAPGFLDTNVPGFIVGARASELKLRDGVTSYLSAHGGLLRDSVAAQRQPTLLNYATTVGLIGMRERTDDDVVAALDHALSAGAYGISLAPEYDPERTTPELMAKICGAFGPRNVPISIHTRYSDRVHELDGIAEALACARAGGPIHVLHLSSTGGTYHPREAAAVFAAARAAGLTMFFDFYPYTFWASSIQRARFRGDWLARYDVDWSRVHTPGRAEPLDLGAFESLRATGTDSVVTVESIPRDTLDFFAVQSDASIGTDSVAGGLVHPRGAGSFAKFLHDYVRSGRISLGAALHRLSTAAVERFAPWIPDLATRGRVEVGYAADLVLWDVDAIADRATVEHPFEPSMGVVAAMVNGVVVIDDGYFSGSVSAAPGRWMQGRLATSRSITSGSPAPASATWNRTPPASTKRCVTPSTCGNGP
jgi:N-acyl-D-aspartate/D-glutamate deacylase